MSGVDKAMRASRVGLVLSIALTLAVVIAALLLVAPRLFPNVVVEYSPLYSQILDVYASKHRTNLAFKRAMNEAPFNMPFLCAMLNSHNLDQRKAVATMLALSDFPAESMTPCMLEALQDPDYFVRLHVAVGFSLRKNKEALPYLIQDRDRSVSEDERSQLTSCIESFNE